MSLRTTIQSFVFKSIHHAFLLGKASLSILAVNKIMPYEKFSVVGDPARQFKSWNNNNDRIILAYVIYQGLKIFNPSIFLPMKNFIMGYIASFKAIYNDDELQDILNVPNIPALAAAEYSPPHAPRLTSTSSQPSSQTILSGSDIRQQALELESGIVERFNNYRKLGEAVNAYYDNQERLRDDLSALGTVYLVDKYELVSRTGDAISRQWNAFRGKAVAVEQQTVEAAAATADKAAARVLEVTSSLIGEASADGAKITQGLQTQALELRKQAEELRKQAEAHEQLRAEVGRRPLKN